MAGSSHAANTAVMESLSGFAVKRFATMSCASLIGCSAGNEQAVEMIKDGTNLKATVKQNFEGMAGIVCEQMEKYFDGEEIEKGEMYAPAELITQENAQ